MKQVMKKFGILSLILVLFVTILPMQDIEAEDSTSIKGILSLKEGREYQYDIDGDGKKDTVYWTLKKEKSKTDSIYTISVYVNEKKIYSKKETGIENRNVALCNIDNRDQYVEILIEDTDFNFSMASCTFLCYNKGKVSTLFHSQNREKKKRYGITNFGQWTIKGDGKVIHKNYSSFSTYTTGCIQLQIPLKLKNGKLVYTAKNDYNLDGHARDNATNTKAAALGKYNYKAGNEITVYKKSNKKSGIAFTMKKGERFYANKLHVAKWKKNKYGYYAGKKFFLQIKTKSGKTGWVYIPSVTNQSQDFTGGGSYPLPFWN